MNSLPEVKISPIKEIDPYNQYDQELITEYDNLHKTNYSSLLNKVRTNYSKNEYLLEKMTCPIGKSILYTTRQEKIHNAYLIDYAKDLRTAHIYYQGGTKNDNNAVVNYIFKNSNIETIIFLIPTGSQSNLQEFEDLDYTTLYDENNIEKVLPLIIERDFEYTKEKGINQ